jgi:hypothetical protein
MGSLLGDTIVATSGCPHWRSYCNLRQIHRAALRFRPIEDVVAEVRTFHSPFFTFWDDQLFMDVGGSYDNGKTAVAFRPARMSAAPG